MAGKVVWMGMIKSILPAKKFKQQTNKKNIKIKFKLNKILIIQIIIKRIIKIIIIKTIIMKTIKVIILIAIIKL